MISRKVFIVVVLALLLSLALVGPAGASDPTGAGFDVDCTGATGYGQVAADTTYIWSVTLNDPAIGWENWQGWVSGGESGSPFHPTIEWGFPLTPGEASVVWNVWAEGGSYCNSGGGCLECFHGCTPGYWKNHLDSWGPTGYSPAGDFDTTFGVDLFDPDITLEQAVNAKGGQENVLARHGTAALLSAAHPHVTYPYSVDDVIDYVQAGNVGPLVDANEEFCPLD
jgi:hypothetical protein